MAQRLHGKGHLAAVHPFPIHHQLKHGVGLCMCVCVSVCVDVIQQELLTN